SRLINNGLLEETQRGRMFEVRVGQSYEQIRGALTSQIEQFDTTIDRVVDLFLRMNTKQAEIAASVHFSASHLSQALGRKPSEIEVLNDVLRWKRRRKPPITPTDIASAIRRLGILGWVDVQISRGLPIPVESAV
ncbi:MAG TPA: Appr-1-p processing protein, partial [Dehalococcoidia bacterium]